MKIKRLIIAIVCLLLTISATEEICAGEEEKHTLDFFYFNVCASCHEEANIYELYDRCISDEEKKTISCEIRTYNTFLDTVMAAYEQRLADAGKEKADVELPVLIVDGVWLSGYETMEAKLHGLLFGDGTPAEETDMPGQELAESSGRPETLGRQELQESPGQQELQESPGQQEPLAGAEAMSDKPESQESPEQQEPLESQGQPESQEGSELPETPADTSRPVITAADDAPAVLLFTTYSCADCDRAKDEIRALQEELDFEVTECSIAEGGNIETFKSLLAQYGRTQEEGKVPAVFAGEHVLLGEEEIRQGLGALLKEGEAPASVLKERLGASAPEEAWGPELASAFGAGFLAGWNPCMISMTLMLLSILITAHASVLKNGLLWLAAKYVTYLGIGCAACFAASGFDQGLLSRYSSALDIVLAVLFFVAAALNFMDFLNVRKEEYGKVRMQLPKRLRRFNHTLLKRAGRAEGAALAFLVLGLGAAVSIGEFFCTGQIYMASILYLLRSPGGGQVRNFVYLLVYVTAMSIPAAAALLVIHVTKATGRVSDFMLRHLGAVKLLNAVLFTLYALYFFLF